MPVVLKSAFRMLAWWPGEFIHVTHLILGLAGVVIANQQLRHARSLVTGDPSLPEHRVVIVSAR